MTQTPPQLRACLNCRNCGVFVENFAFVAFQSLYNRGGEVMTKWCNPSVLVHPCQYLAPTLSILTLPPHGFSPHSALSNVPTWLVFSFRFWPTVINQNKSFNHFDADIAILSKKSFHSLSILLSCRLVFCLWLILESAAYEAL